MTWRVAESLEKLRRQINAAFPFRSKVSDGSIGDAKHASRNSDHNPWVKDRKGQPIVTARDFTHDPRNGVDCNQLAKELVASRDPRIKYIIWNRQICSSVVSAWKWRPYKGANAHTKHLHISVNSSQGLYDKTDDWKLPMLKNTAEKVIANLPKVSSVAPIVKSSNESNTEIPEAVEGSKPSIENSGNILQIPVEAEQSAIKESLTEKLQEFQATAVSTVSQIQEAANTVGQAKQTFEAVKEFIPANSPTEKVTSGKSTSFFMNLFAGFISLLSAVWGFFTDNWKLIVFGVLGVILIGVTIAVTFTIINHYKMKYASDPHRFNVE